MIMLGKRCKICYAKKADLKLPSCSHALCKECWWKIYEYEEHPKCPWCRKIQYWDCVHKILRDFSRLHPIAQGLIMYGIWKLIVS